ncbi:MAG TPA: deoxyguanosinetriphosphate triphosphohydrolase [Aggregatilineales bacterium]|nr:deoxyguanosinetriphosphate triphosphohydrolase [Aggregatilineales bacterium]
MIVTRQQCEDIEMRTLAPYALKARESRGRHYPEPDDAFRTAFQRDRDRILHTTAFRRLEYKTQVFVNYEGDYYRTRLTHTLEVAQIGRTIAQALGANETLVETICMAHDLGHSPFGHAGEDILNLLMQDHGGFDHNLQTYRIVTELEERYPGWPGLNLTHETLEGIEKHESKYDRSSSLHYDPTTRGSLEAQIANAADEVAYNTHDLDDGLRAELLMPDQVETLAIWQRVRRGVGLTDTHFDEMVRHRLIRHLLGMEIEDMIHATHHRLQEARVDSVAALQHLPTNVIGCSAELVALNNELKDFLFVNLYRHYRVVRMSVKAKRVLRELFEAYTGEPAQLPSEIQKKIESRGLHRAVADYIAGMTDRFALQEHERLFDPMTRP